MYSTIQKILVSKLPRLSKKKIRLGMDSEGNFTVNGYDLATSQKFDTDKCFLDQTEYIKNIFKAFQDYIVFTHSDILEVLGEDWAMTGDYQLCQPRKDEPFIYFDEKDQHFHTYPTLPQNLHDLDLPEHKETAERLISLLS